MKRIKNWKLIAILGVLLLIFAAVKIFRSPQLERNLPDTLAEVDSAKVTELVIIPGRETTSEIHLVRTGNNWSIRNGERTGRLEQGGAATALRSLMDLRPERFVTRKKEKWNEFNVGDSTSTQVKVMTGSSVEADLRIGRTGYYPQSTSGITSGAYTFVRIGTENEVYTVNGFLDGQFNRSFNDWLDKTYTRLKSDSVTRISFRYPADSSFVLEKRGSVWASGPDKVGAGTSQVDSVTVTTYLRDLAFKNLSTIVDTAPVGEPQAVITFEGRSGTIAKLEGWPAEGQWILGSSYQPETYFSSKGSEIMNEVWKGKKHFSSGK